MPHTTKAVLAIAVIALGFFWRPAWYVLVGLILIQWVESRWKELLDAIRTRQTTRSETGSETMTSENIPDNEIDPAQVERALVASDYKHILGQPWGDPSSYIKASAEAEAVMDAAREKRTCIVKATIDAGYEHIPGPSWSDPGSYVKALNLEEVTPAVYEREVEQEREKQEEQKPEQQAREFLIRESERVQRQREQREEWQKAKEDEPSKSLSGAPTPLVVIRPPSNKAEDEVCKCGYPGCLGHEVIDNHAMFPGFTSEAALARSPHEIVRFLVEVVGVAGNPSDGDLPVSAIQALRKPRD